MKRLRWLVLLACVGLFAGAAHAQPTAADKETARSLLLDGRAKMDAKDYAGALKSFEGAHAIMKVPTTGVALAKAHAALGHLLEARELALDVTRIPAEKGEAQAFADARTEAADLAAKIAPRIPSVTIDVRGPDSATVEARLDGALVATATLGLPRKVNPGHHVITAAAAGFASIKKEIDVKELDAQKVELTMEPAAGPGPTATAVPTAPPVVTSTSIAPFATAPFATATATGPAETQPPPKPIWAWIAGGTGLVALGVGAGFFADYLGVRDTIAKDCPGNVCDPAKQDASSAQSLRGQWNRDIGLTVGFGAVALAGIGVAIVGLTQKPASTPARTSSAPGNAARATLRVNASGIAVEGAF